MAASWLSTVQQPECGGGEAERQLMRESVDDTTWKARSDNIGNVDRCAVAQPLQQRDAHAIKLLIKPRGRAAWGGVASVTMVERLRAAMAMAILMDEGRDDGCYWEGMRTYVACDRDDGRVEGGGRQRLERDDCMARAC